MANVLTIRDPQTGHLLAKERLRPEEEIEAAVARVFRKTLGPDVAGTDGHYQVDLTP